MRLAAGAALCLLTACAQQPTTGLSGSSGEQASQTALTRLGLAAGDATNAAPAELPTADTKAALTLQRRTYGVVQLAALEQPLRQTLQQVQRASANLVKPAQAYLTPDPAFTAYSTQDGGIFISQGLVRSMESEDELAAVIAHEYAHILLGHHQESMLSKGTRYLYGGAMLYMSMSGKADIKNDNFLRKWAVTELGLESVQTGITPATTREQEDEADQLGIDLMLRAGYNDIGMTNFLTRLETWESQKIERELQRVEALKKSEALASARSKVRKDPLEALIRSTLDSGIEQAGKTYEEMRRQHKTSAKRFDLTRDYLDQFYGDHVPPTIKPLPWSVSTDFSGFDQLQGAQQAMQANQPQKAGQLIVQALKSPIGDAAFTRFVTTEVLIALGQKNNAAVLQQQAALSDEALLPEYINYAESVQRQNPEAALAMYDRAYQLFDSPNELLPERVRLNKRMGHTSTVSFLVARCIATSGRDVRDACMEAQK